MKELQAFPVSYNGHEGMSLRDYFAAAFVSSGHVFKSDTPVNTAERVAAQAYQLADAMLEARNGSR